MGVRGGGGGGVEGGGMPQVTDTGNSNHYQTPSPCSVYHLQPHNALPEGQKDVLLF